MKLKSSTTSGRDTRVCFLVSLEEHARRGANEEHRPEVGFKLYVWSTTTGLVDTEKGATRQANRPDGSPVGHPGIVPRKPSSAAEISTCS